MQTCKKHAILSVYDMGELWEWESKVQGCTTHLWET